MKITADPSPGPETQTSGSPVSTDCIAPRNRMVRQLAAVVFLNIFVFSPAIMLLTHLFYPQLGGRQLSNLTPTLLFLKGVQGNDSLGAMLPAIHMLEDNSKAPVYESIFFEQHTKFQYPLTSLLPYYALQRLGASDTLLYRISKIVSYLCVGFTIFFILRIALRFLPSYPSPRARNFDIVLTGATILIGSLFFCPLASSCVLGQVQTLLTFAFALALYCWITGRETAAGILIGLMTLVKPQYGLFFLWALLRKKLRPAAAGLICVTGGALLSCAVFGLHNNLEYFQVLRSIGSVGESFVGNQSANGLLNRLLFNGNNLFWDGTHFPPYNSIVYFGTLATSLGLLALSLFYPWGKSRQGGTADFACIILISTMASPVAWIHHYAITLAILVWLWFRDYGHREPRRGIWMIVAAYVLLSNGIPPLAALAQIPVLNIFESYLYLGAILLLILLLKSRAEEPETIPQAL